MASNILIVENDKDFRKTLFDYLSIEGYKVFESQSVSGAKEIFKNQRFNAVVIDVRLKDDEDTFDWSGLVFARTIAGQNIPAIILTSHESVESAYSVAPGIKPPAAFISKNDPHYLEKVSEKLGELAAPPKGGPGTWLKKNWEKMADIILGILKKIFKFG